MSFKVGDKVKLNIPEKEFVEVLRLNKDIENEIMLCHKAPCMTITEIIDYGGVFGDGLHYSVDVDNGKTAWLEEDLVLIEEAKSNE